jgi:hypothetical protein
MSLGENISNIICKSKHTFHFLKAITRALTSRTIGDESIIIVDLTQNLPPKKTWKKKWECNPVFQNVWAIKIPWVELMALMVKWFM